MADLLLTELGVLGGKNPTKYLKSLFSQFVHVLTPYYKRDKQNHLCLQRAGSKYAPYPY